MTKSVAADRWRRLLNVQSMATASALESLSLDDSTDRIKRAKEAMTRLVQDRFGGDTALLEALDGLLLTSKEAIDILATESVEEPSVDHLGALEAIVAFDGTRPSFLVKDNRIDFNSSYNTGPWRTELQSYANYLTNAIGCVGRVELGERHIGTGFLVTPTLAITNRHVAQSIAGFDAGQIISKPNVFLDFGREQWNGRVSFDRRKVEEVVFAGKDAVFSPVDHKKLDLAVLRLSSSLLGGDHGKRSLLVNHMGASDFFTSAVVATAGFPAAPDLYVPNTLKSKYDAVLKKLLEGEGGAKRFAPGVPAEFAGDSGPAKWTVAHDATTINGNSGSPVFVLGGVAAANIRLAGLHYGGDWGGERTNWAHLLAITGSAVGYGGSKTFAEFCQSEGIML
jgi:V8-like Glu-specific endopeptidase